MLKSACLILLAAACVLLTGCRRDAEINSALTEVDSFTKELENLIKADPSSKGVDNAQQYLDARKREIKLKTSYLTRVRGIQVSDETEKRLIETVRRDQMTITSLPSIPNLPVNDAAFKTKLDKLINDYLELFQA
ncbi:MAG: hypothetical protein ICV60_19765 [Pyrinomonadaceae bacterium]|nr:hypothetical protein [Pyrinomonadaceae bacterium]